MNTGIQESVDNIDGILEAMKADNAGAIIADLMHWCDQRGVDFNEMFKLGTYYYEDEVKNAKESG